jgi:hypothetical protein
VEHLQASREIRASDGTDRSRNALARRRARILEIEADLPEARSVPWGDAPFGDLAVAERVERTQALIERGLSDHARWAAVDSLKPAWGERAEVVAAVVGAVPTVLDLGCGRMDLERALAPGVRYIPADLVARDDRTHVCDLNRGEWPDVSAATVTLLGVLEYIFDPAALFKGLADRWPRVVLTYSPAELAPGQERRGHGWVNALTSAELVALAQAAGLELQLMVPVEPRQRIFEFVRGAPA